MISMFLSDMLYVLQHFNLYFIPFLLLILSCSITIVQHLRLDYCENFKLKWNMYSSVYVYMYLSFMAGWHSG